MTLPSLVIFEVSLVIDDGLGGRIQFTQREQSKRCKNATNNEEPNNKLVRIIGNPQKIIVESFHNEHHTYKIKETRS